MRFVTIESVSVSNKAMNEDAVASFDNFAFVIDGASPLCGKGDTLASNITSYVDFLKNYVAGRHESGEIVDILTSCIREIRKRSDLNIAYTEDIDSSSAAFLSVRLLEDGAVEYYTIGDCSLLVELADGEILEICDKTVPVLDAKVVAEMLRISKEKSISVCEARRYVLDMLRAHRKKKNTPDGYWILGLNPEAVSMGRRGVFEAGKIVSCCLLTDGFSDYYNTMRIVDSPAEFFSALKHSGAEHLLSQLVQAQERDSGCNLHPRLKKEDDASLVFLSIAE